MNVYPEQLRQIVAYCEALNEADKKIGFDINPGMQVDLLISVVDEDGRTVLGTIVDEIGGAWGFKAAQ
jgi:hypothetical protein